MTSLASTVNGPLAMCRINTTTMLVDSNSGFKPASFVKNGTGHVTLIFDDQTRADVQGECNVQVTPCSVVPVIVGFDGTAGGDDGVQIFLWDIAGAPFDAFVCVAVWRVLRP